MSKKIVSISSKAFEEKIGTFVSSLEIPFKDITNYCLAFIHRSVLNENIIHTPESNERLEFLGDAVLELISTELLFHAYPEKPEGELTDIRSALVRGKNLASIGLKLQLQDYVLVSKGELLAGGNTNPYIVANTVEAFLGALYLDLGYGEAKKFVEKYVYSTLSEILEKQLYVDPKSYLQEISQAKYSTTPTYEVLKESGSDHSKSYTVGVYIGINHIGTGIGSSKKKAQQEAAENALSLQETWEKEMKI
ncbi:MAG: ribonuclease III [Candidatus Gracilibacteria bacterium]|nr:ribonuclease III [Candidatus Gracilibacteria bacterium]